MHNLGPSNSWWKKTSVQLHWLFWSYLRKGAFVKYLLFELAEAVTRCKVLRSSWAHMCLTREGPEVSISGWETKFSSQRGFFCSEKYLISVLHLQGCHQHWPWKRHFLTLLLCLSACTAPENYSFNLQSVITKLNRFNFDLKLLILCLSCIPVEAWLLFFKETLDSFVVNCTRWSFFPYLYLYNVEFNLLSTILLLIITDS